jgi:hypothetical protein
MAFAIMRAKKLKGMGSVAASLQHCYRDRETANADRSLTPDNEHHVARSTDEAMGKLRELLPAKRRKDAVLVVEYVMTASPEWWKSARLGQQRDFFEVSKKWLVDKFGAQNIVTASVHRDEITPHLSAFVVPLTQDGRLSAKDFIGNRTKMTRDQTMFAKVVEHLGLERGIERSKAKHQSIQKHYAAIERGLNDHVTITPGAVMPRVLEKGFFTRREETLDAVAERLTKAVREEYEPTMVNAAVSTQERRRVKELQRTALEQQKRLQSLQEPFVGLSKEQFRDVLTVALKYQRQNEVAREAREKQIVKHQRETLEQDHDLEF